MQVGGDCPEPMLPATTVELVDGLARAHAVAASAASTRPRTTRSTTRRSSTPTCSSSAAARPGSRPRCARPRSGARVMLLDDQPELGGALLSGRRAGRRRRAGLGRGCRGGARGAPEVTVLTRTSAFGLYDDNYLLAVERRTDHLDARRRSGVSRQRLWHIRAAAGRARHRRPRAAAGVRRQRPARRHAGRRGPRPTSTGTPSCPATGPSSRPPTTAPTRRSHDLLAAGVEVVAVSTPGRLSRRAAEVSARRRRGRLVQHRAGRRRRPATGRLRRVHVGTLDDDDEATCWESLDCDLARRLRRLEPGGASAQPAQGRLRWDDGWRRSCPTARSTDQQVVGAAAGDRRPWTPPCATGAIAGAEAAASGRVRRRSRWSSPVPRRSPEPARSARSGWSRPRR